MNRKTKPNLTPPPDQLWSHFLPCSQASFCLNESCNVACPQKLCACTVLPPTILQNSAVWCLTHRSAHNSLGTWQIAECYITSVLASVYLLCESSTRTCLNSLSSWTSRQDKKYVTCIGGFATTSHTINRFDTGMNHCISACLNQHSLLYSPGQVDSKLPTEMTNYFITT